MKRMVGPPAKKLARAFQGARKSRGNTARDASSPAHGSLMVRLEEDFPTNFSRELPEGGRTLFPSSYGIGILLEEPGEVGRVVGERFHFRVDVAAFEFPAERVPRFVRRITEPGQSSAIHSRVLANCA